MGVFAAFTSGAVRQDERRFKGLFAGIVAAALVVAGLAFAAPPASADTTPTSPGEPETVTSVPLPTAQIDGVAWTQAIAGNTVFVGGEFSSARPAGAAAGVNTSPRANLMAYTLSTGVMTSWNPGSNGAIRSIVSSPDGSVIYVGGTFTTIAGVSRSRIAAFNAATGAILPWNPAANGSVTDIAVRGDTVWIGGDFSYIGGASRVRIASVSATTAKALAFTATLAGGYGVRSLVVDPSGSKVVVAGSFESANGSTNPGRGMAALDAITGGSLPWAVNSIIRNAGTKAAMYSLASDGDSVYGTGYDFGGGPEDGFEGVFRANWSDGSIVWLEDCHGDDYSVAVSSGVVYSASHDHYCGNIGGFPQTSPNWSFHHSLAFAKNYLGNTLNQDIYGYKSYTGQPAATLLNWFPDWQVGTYTGKSQAAWDIAANDDYVLYGGEFLKVNNVGQQGLVRFAKKGVAPDTDGPQLSGTGFPVSALSLRAGEVRLSWSANWDRDNARLTYQLYRQGTAAPIYETTADSNFWTSPDMKFVDRSVTPGTTYQYRVRAIDPNGNAAMGAYTSVTASNTAASAYSLGVLDDGAVNYWPLTESSGTSGVNWADGSDLVVNSATRGDTGPNLATASKSTTFAGTSGSFAAAKTSTTGPDTFSIETWVKTTSTSGGKIVGFGNSRTADSGSYDRHVYMSGDGRITFGVYPGGVRTVQSGTGYNDGQWHYIVATMGGAGMNLYVDGKRVDGRGDTTTGQPYTGYWKVGGDNLGGWPNVGSSNYLSGSISDVAIYDRVLTRSQIDTHWVKSGRTSTVPSAPSDAYGKAVYDLAPTVFWRLGEANGLTASDSSVDANQGTYYGSVTKGVNGALAGVSNTAIALNPSGGTQTGVVSNSAFSNPTTFALETWFKTNTTSGGKIIGFGNAQTGTSSSYDRHVYMSGDGTVKFGVWTGSAQVIQSASGYNDNKWHHVVAQMSSAGMQLYLDGVLVATSPNNQAQDYSGYWRVGGDSGWEGDQYWRGSVDEVAVYPVTLTAAQVSAHQVLGLGTTTNQPPVAAFSSSVSGMSASFDGSASSDAEGPISSYGWDFGDGQSGSGATVSHPYGAAGTYHVTLTVTDGAGATNAVMHDVVIAAPPVSNVLAKDLFERSGANGWGTADVGGGWTIASGAASAFSVSGGSGVMRVATSTGLRVNLPGVTSANTKVVTSFTVDKVAAGQQITVIGRQVGADYYNARAQVAADGTVKLVIFRNQSSFGAAVTVPGIVLTPGTPYTLAFEVKGVGTTTLAAKLWKTDATEPASWLLTKTDTTAVLQTAGSVGLDAFVPTSAGAFPVTLAFTDITVTDPTIP